jgi:hypothetical protein
MKTVTKREGWKFFVVVILLFVAKNLTNLKIALKNMGLRSGIRKKPISDPRSRGSKGTGSRIRNTGRKLW